MNRKTRKLIAAAASAKPAERHERRDDRLRQKESRPALMHLRIAWSCSAAKSRAATAERRGAGVMAYVGPNGGGKTLCAVQDTLPALLAGKPVFANTPLLDPATEAPWDSYRPILHADELLDIDGGAEVLLDEMATVANSRESQRLDPRFQIAFQQLRKRGAGVRWTAPSFMRADLIFREVTQMITECRGHFPDRRLMLDEWGLPDVWAPKRVFSRSTYDALEFTEWTAGKRDRAEPIVREWAYPQQQAIDPRSAYRTMQGVDKVAGIVVDGNCAHCGKKARAEYCKGHTDAEIEQLAAEAAAELARSRGRHADFDALVVLDAPSPAFGGGLAALVAPDGTSGRPEDSVAAETPTETLRRWLQ